MTEHDLKTIEMDCELSLEQLEPVAVGLNPQPLPRGGSSVIPGSAS